MKGISQRTKYHDFDSFSLLFEDAHASRVHVKYQIWTKLKVKFTSFLVFTTY